MAGAGKQTEPTGGLRGSLARELDGAVAVTAAKFAADSKFARMKGLPGALCREQEGATAVLIAMSLVVFLGAVALSVDLSRSYNLKTQLQQAADASALAAASQMDSTAGSLARACEAATGQAAYPCLGPTAGNLATAIVANEQKFASDGLGGDVAVFKVRFLVALGTGPGDPDPTSRIYIDTLGLTPLEADLQARFVEVTVVPREVAFPFAAAIGAVDSASPGAVAVSGLGEATCKVPPLMVCNPDDDGSNPPFFANANMRRGIMLDEGGNGQWVPGNFGLLSVTDQPGANAVRDAFGRVNPIAACFGQKVNTLPGQVTDIRQGLNVRFNIYGGSFGQSEITDPQYLPSFHPAKGLIKAGNKCTFNGSGGNGWTKPANPFGYDADKPGGWAQGKGPSTDMTLVIDAMGLPRDNCHYDSDPVLANLGAPLGGVCPDFRWGDGEWDLATYMRINHENVIYSAPGMGTMIGGVDVDTEPYGNADGWISRFETYEWEKDTFLAAPVTGGIPGTGTSAPTTEVAWPGGAAKCANYSDATPPPELTPDRRVIAVAVVNCISPIHDCGSGAGCGVVQGNTKDVLTTVPDGFLGIFLTEAMGTFDSNNTLYGEVIGKVESEKFATISRKIVQLYE